MKRAVLIFLAAYIYVLCGIGTLRATQVVTGTNFDLASQLFTVATWPSVLTAAATYKLMTL